MWWLMSRLNGRYGFLVAWDEEVVDDFVERFPEANKSLRVYTLGPNSCPMLNRAARRAYDLGYVLPNSIGNQDARSFNQRTWARTWRLTSKGIAALKALAEANIAREENAA